jgi:hypothetical protein
MRFMWTQAMIAVSIDKIAPKRKNGKRFLRFPWGFTKKILDL